MFKLAKISTGLLLIASSSAFAAADGFYIGGQLGADNAGYRTGQFPYMTSAQIFTSGLAGGAFFGYQFSPMLAAQVGYVRGNRVSVKNITLATPNPTNQTTLANGGIALNIWDAALKVMLPLKYGVGLSGKVGAAYINANTSGGINNHTLGGIYVNNSKWAPEAGLGGSYDFNQNVTTGLEYTHTFKSGPVPHIDMLLANLAYHFG
jgi:hypothetical protein